MRGRVRDRGVTGLRGWLPVRGRSAAVLAAVVGAMPLVSPPHALAAARYRVTRTIRVGYYPNGVAVDPGTRTAFVANSRDNTVSVIDEATGTVTRTIYLGHYTPYAVAVDPRTHTAYVTNWLYDSVSVISRHLLGHDHHHDPPPRLDHLSSQAGPYRTGT
jgi:YVTN family beta-propeller protein